MQACRRQRLGCDRGLVAIELDAIAAAMLGVVPRPVSALDNGQGCQEFFAADAGQAIPFTQPRHQQPADRTQHLVTNPVAMVSLTCLKWSTSIMHSVTSS